MKKICSLYDINIFWVLKHPMKKSSWKNYYKKTVRDYWNHHITLMAASRSSLKWLLLGLIPRNKPHGVWASCHGIPHLVEAATTRARMLIGRYSCGESPWMRESDPLCKLCGKEDSVRHILAECPYTTPTGLINCFTELFESPPANSHELTSAILNGEGFRRKLHLERVIPKYKTDAHIIASKICHEAHKMRDIQLNNKLMNDPDLEITLPYGD